METAISDIKLECIQGNIVQQEDCDAIVNAANARLRTGGGVAGAIHRAAGPELAKECEPMAPIKPGEAVISSGQNLPNKHVIHCLGPVHGRDKPEDKLLGNCYRNALDLAEKHKLACIAFPAISTGAFGYPLHEAAEVSWKAVIDKLDELKNVKTIRFVMFSREDEKIYSEALQKLTSNNQ